MPNCASCRAELPEGSAFCSQCGARVSPADPLPPTDEAGHQPQEPQRGLMPMPAGNMRRGLRIAVILLLMLALLGGVGYGVKVSSDRAAAAAAAKTKLERDRAAAAKAKAELEKRTAELAKARSEASDVLKSVEKCESAVEAGVTLTDLQRMSTEARQDMLAFSRTPAADLLPDFTKKASAAADAYVLSCNLWMDSNKAAQTKYDAAFNRWTAGGYSGASPQIKDYQDDSKFQKAWSDAGDAIASARSVLKVETTAPTTY